VRTLRRQHPGARDASTALLQSLLRGALHGLQCVGTSGRGGVSGAGLGAAMSSLAAMTPLSSTAPDDPVAKNDQGLEQSDVGTSDAGRSEDAKRATSGAVVLPVQDDERGPVLPLRLGLRLLTDSEMERSVRPGADDGALSQDGVSRRAASHEPYGVHRDGTPGGQSALAWFSAAAQDGSVIPHAALSAWGTAAPRYRDTVPTGTGAQTPHVASGPGAGAIAVLCVILAACAAATGYPALAVAFGVGAAWMALRRSGGAGTSAEASPALQQQSARARAGAEPADDARNGADPADDMERLR